LLLLLLLYMANERLGFICMFAFVIEFAVIVGEVR
jgi:hypothetical protein